MPHRRSILVTSPRQAAVQVLQRVLVHGRTLPDALAPFLAKLPDSRDRALCQEICYGVLRWHSRLEALVLGLLEQRPRSRDRDLALLLETGLYQLLYTEVPSHAAVSATVDTTRELGKSWAARWVNAVLRRFQREHDDRLRAADVDRATRYAMPAWLLQWLAADWPEEWESLVRASNVRAPLTVRVNRRRISREAWLAQLGAIPLAGASVAGLPQAVILDQPRPVDELPGFADGKVSVQDAAAQFAAIILALQPGQRVLDACAAPGGKTAHILEQAAVALTALDIDAQRLARVDENLVRLGLRAKLLLGDAADPESWWDGQAFDRILVDAPCSGTGVIRRHPDIKWLRRPDDLPALTATQQRLLEQLWPLLASGGRLIYATCSVLRVENDTVIESFLRGHPDAAVCAPDIPLGRALQFGHQILPGERDMDGFYYACLEKG